MSNWEIFKVQTPIGGNGPNKALIYNKDRTKEFFSNITDEIRDLVIDDHKGFAYGFQGRDGNFVYTGTAPKQYW